LGMNARGDNPPIGELQILRSGAERSREWRSNAANAANEEYVVVVAFCLPDLPEYNMHPRIALRCKAAILRACLDRPVKIVTPLAKTSVEEAEGICGALREQGVKPEKIVIVCDFWHYLLGLRGIWVKALTTFSATKESWWRRLLNSICIWRRVISVGGIVVEFQTVHCQFGPDYALAYMHSKLRWIMHGIARVILLKTGLMKWAVAWLAWRSRR